MTDLRRTLAALSVVAALLASTASMFAQANHDACGARQHECGKVVKISSCCCGEGSASQHDSTPVQPRVEVRADMTTTVVPNGIHVLSAPPASILVLSAPPRFCPLDLPTLFVTFLI